jgi:hypothetical protein
VAGASLVVEASLAVVVAAVVVVHGNWYRPLQILQAGDQPHSQTLPTLWNDQPKPADQKYLWHHHSDVSSLFYLYAGDRIII